MQRELGALASRTYAVLALLRRRVQDLARRRPANTADADNNGEDVRAHVTRDMTRAVRTVTVRTVRALAPATGASDCVRAGAGDW